MKNIQYFLPENFHFLVVKFSIYLNRHVFLMFFFFFFFFFCFFFCFIYKSPRRSLPSYESTDLSIQEKKHKIDFVNSDHSGHL